jgi:hypothetical protein
MRTALIIGGRRLWVAHQHHFLRNASAALFQFGAAFLLGPPNRINGFFDQLDAVGLQPTGLTRGDEGRAPVNADLDNGLGISAMSSQVLGKGLDRISVLAQTFPKNSAVASRRAGR